MFKALRIFHHKKSYMDVFEDKERDKLREALSGPSLLEFVDDWLCSFLNQNTKRFDFWTSLKGAVHAMLDELKAKAEVGS